ncbi:MAG: hypothetical protein AB7F98_00320 [Novosphingobium sp.]
MTFWQLVAATFGPALLIAALAPRRRLLAAMLLLSALGLAAVVLFMSVKVFTCGGEICLTNFIVAMFAGVATIAGDMILLVRWFLHRRKPLATDSTPK